MVDLAKGGSFTFLGFEYRRILSRNGVWRPYYAPKLKKRTALFAKLREVFRRNVSQPIGKVIDEINPILRGWANYFRVGHSNRCFSMVKHWVEKKIRRHLMRARGRKGMGWKRWSREWLDSFVCVLVQRLRFFRSFDPLPSDGHLLSRPHGKTALIRQLRYYLHEVSAAAGIPIRIVPHQLRHTYASEMVRSGVTLPAVMKLLGHADPGTTMRYVQVTPNDLQNEFQMARSQPRHLAPHPKAPTISPGVGLHGVVESLLFSQHAIEMFRRSLPDGPPRRCLDRLSNRLTKILSQARRLSPAP